jgi:hypothetical protein
MSALTTPRSAAGPEGPRPRRRLVLSVALAAGLVAATFVAAPTVAGASGTTTARFPAAPLVDPGDAGPSAVDVLSYNLGRTAFQPENFAGKVEVKARVYAPQTIVGRAPLVILLHGRHSTCASTTNADDIRAEWPCPTGFAEIPSYAGYDVLGRNLASHGMIVASIGANGINAADDFTDDGGAQARAELILHHLGLWKSWDTDPTGPLGSRFVGHVDLSRVGLMGHSRGGEGVVVAADINLRLGQPYGIKAVVALAPVDFGDRSLTAVPLQVVLPYCDGDVSDLQGAKYYDDSRYAIPGDPAPKQTTLLYGANHNFFNSVWTTGPGSFDDAEFGFDFDEPDPSGTCTSGSPGRLPAGTQRAAGTDIMASFLRRFLSPDPALQPVVTGVAPFPASAAGARWVVAWHEPQRLDVNRYASLTTARTNNRDGLSEVRRAVAEHCDVGDRFFFDEGSEDDQNRCPAAMFFGGIPSVTSLLDIAWVRPGAQVTEDLAPTGTDVTGFDGLRFRVAVIGDARNLRRSAQDLSVVLVDTGGHRASVAVSEVTNALQRPPADSPFHSVLGGVRVPLVRFAGVDLTHVARVELVADRTASGRLGLSDLAFTQEGTGPATGPTQGAVGATHSPFGCSAARADGTRWACAAMSAILGRQPQESEFRAFRSHFDTAADRETAVRNLVRGPTATNRRLRELFIHLGESLPIDFVIDSARQQTSRTVEGGFPMIGEGVFIFGAGLDTPGQLVDAGYLGLLGRPADAGGRAHWVAALNRTGNAQTFVRALVRSREYAEREVDDLYRAYLGRRASAGIREHWIDVFTSGRGGERDLQVHVLASSEFVGLVTM